MTSLLETFVKTPSVELLDSFKREELISLAKHYKISYKVSMRKQEIKNLVIEGLVDKEIFSYDALEYVEETTSALKLRQLELEYELKLEQARIEQSQKEMELELQRE